MAIDRRTNPAGTTGPCGAVERIRSGRDRAAGSILGARVDVHDSRPSREAGLPASLPVYTRASRKSCGHRLGIEFRLSPGVTTRIRWRDHSIRKSPEVENEPILPLRS